VQTTPPQFTTHVPAVQTPPTPHARPQAPQFSGSVARSTQALPHAIRPPEHEAMQNPATQVCPLAHASPHALQLAALVLRFTSQPLAAAPSQSA